MKCPYCDSTIKEVPDSGTCPRCGGLLAEGVKKRNKRKELVFPDPPIGVYKDAAGYLEIGKDSVTFYRKQWPFAPKTRRMIPYNEIFAVSFGEGKPLSSGFLCVREWQDRHLSLATKAAEIAYDETSVYFRKEDNEKFFNVYQFLRQCADIVNAEEEEACKEGKVALLGKYKGYYGYMELGENAVAFVKDIVLAAPTKRIIPYSEIAEVKIQQAAGAKNGGLSIRARNDGKMLETALRNAVIDDSSIDFGEDQNEKMLEVYAFLMNHVRDNFNRWSA